MEIVQNISDISKETLTFLAFFDKKMIEKIPMYIITKLCEEAADSKQNFYIDVNKSFDDQVISEKSKDLISLIYYDYIAEEEEKKEILKQWNLNEEKYNYNNIFTNKKSNNCVKLIEVKKDTIFKKIIYLLRKIIKGKNFFERK